VCYGGKISKQVYLYVVSRRKTDGYKDSPASGRLCTCGCKNKQNSWIWQGFFSAFSTVVAVVAVVAVFFHRFAP
jgi:hypothetical protein